MSAGEPVVSSEHAGMVMEETEQGKKSSFDIHRYLDIVRRRHLYFLVPLLLGWLIVWAAGWVLPPRYKSGTLILVERPSMPKDYVTPNVSEDLQDRLQSITQEILSRTRLLIIIDQMKLYGGGRRQMSPTEKVERMRKDINIELVRDAQEQITSFNIFYSAQDPRIAQEVCGRLTKLFINANMEIRQQESEDTTNFLENQMETARAALAAQEAKVREFEGEHIGELPAQQASNLQVLSGLQAELVNEQDALNTAQQQKVYLEALINQYHAMQPAVRTTGTASVSLPTDDQELDRMRADLTALQYRHTDRYPDVQALKEQIARAEKSADAGAVQGRVQTEGSRPEEIRPRLDPAQHAALLQVESQLQANRAEVANREATVASLKAKIDGYQARLSQEPVREQQLADLTRGYEQSKANFDDLLKKKNGSEMATRMERMKEGERFIMLDPPSLPGKPDFPNRLKFCVFGLGFGIALGLAFALGSELLGGRLYSESEIAKLLPTSVILEIPEVANASDHHAQKRRMFFGWATAAVVLATILAGSAFTVLHT